MDRLGADQAEQLRKCSTDRLRIKLSKAGGDEETIAAMGRDQLLDMLATLMLAPPPQPLVILKSRHMQNRSLVWSRRGIRSQK